MRNSVFIEQAVFGSGVTAQTAGYQILSASAGLDDDARRAILRLAPSHDGLANGWSRAIAGQPLPDGRYVLMAVRRRREYSGRGVRVTTRAFVLPADVLSRFAGRPDAVLEALAAKGALRSATPLRRGCQRFVWLVGQGIMSTKCTPV
ncbi:MAG: hypothetical protein QM811_01595 [Pirellulales bacterium]